MAADSRHLLFVLLFLSSTIMTSFSAHRSNSSRAIPPSEYHSALPPQPVRPHPSGRRPSAPSPSSPVLHHPSGRQPSAPSPSSPVLHHPSGRQPSALSPSSPVRPHPSGRRPSPPSPSPVRPHPSAAASSSALDPKQLRALHSFEIPTAKDPCSPSPRAAVVCDSSKPYRHVLSLRLANCSDDLSLSSTDLKSLATLTSLVFISCPIPPPRFPHILLSSLRSFTVVHSLHKLTGVWLSRLQNLTDLTVSDVPVKASGPAIVVGKMKNLRSITISGANLTGSFPKKLHPNLTLIDLSANRLRGRIPSSLTLLDKLQSLNLSSNSLTGELPSAMGDLLSLKTASFSSNSLSGRIPGSMSSLRSLTHLDLSSNQFNGTVPKFLTGMKSLKHLNLENNSFTGVLPFNSSFIKKMIVLKVGRNSDLCYNHSNLPSKLKLGIAPCDKHGLPESPPASKDSSPGGDDSDYSDSAGDETEKPKGRHHHGPNKVVLGVAIALAAIIFLIVFLILLSKWCA